MNGPMTMAISSFWHQEPFGPPPPTNHVITEAGDNIVTEGGDQVVIES